MSSRLSSQLRWRQAKVAGSTGPLALAGILAAPAAAAGHFQALASTLAAAAPVPVGHDPELSTRDEAVYLLHVAAEVEHALLAQYLYATFSLRRAAGLTPEQQGRVDVWRGTLFQIAKEEMAHLLAVQNVLRLLGGPLNLEREDYPFRSDVYPFHFRLEPLTKNVLAKYVFAESSPAADYPEKDDVRTRATKHDPSDPLNHVGAIYEAIIARIQALTPADFRPDPESVGYQAPRGDWAFGRPGPSAPGGVDPNLVLDVVGSREQAVALLTQIAQQGEAAETPSTPPGAQPSHFARFLQIFRDFPDGEWSPTDALPTNPSTAKDPIADDDLEAGRISHPLARRWAQLFDARYRMLLMDLLHLLHLGGDKEEVDGTERDTLRPQIRGRAFAEMGNLREICEHLVRLPLRADGSGGLVAAPCFELPYTLALPLLELDRWRLHRDLAADTSQLAALIRTPPAGGEDVAETDPAALALLDRLEDGDRIRAITLVGPRIEQLGGEAAPALPPTIGFQKDIRPLFRPMDIAHMKAIFPTMDLASFDSVKARRQKILEALQDPIDVMPPDAPWPQAAIDLFKKWSDDPKP